MNHEQLLASLTEVSEDRDALVYDDRTIDWSLRFDGGRRFSFEDGTDDFVGFDLTWPEIERLQKALTLLLLTHED
jgi:hypothetical protein